MNKLNFSLIPKIKSLYEAGENIIEYFKITEKRSYNSIEDILISYDLQAGSYVLFAEKNQNYILRYTQELASVINALGEFNSFMEVGVGEATTLANLIPQLLGKKNKYFGFDISWSRINVAKKYLIKKKISAQLFVADLFNIPLDDSSIDIVYTSHSIEPNGGKEKEAIIELYRVAKKYLVLLEPTNEFADTEGKIRMKDNGYVQDLINVLNDLKLNVITYGRFPVNSNSKNPTGLYVIKKDNISSSSDDNIFFKCPISSKKLEEFDDHYFSKDSLLSYPKILGIPCLCDSYAVLTSKHD